MDLFAFAEARELRDAGMTQAAEHSPVFSEIAFQAIKRVARRQIHVHVDDILREDVPTPSHPNAWGPVWMRAIREDIIQRTNQTRQSEHTKKHSHNYPIYFSLIYQGVD